MAPSHGQFLIKGVDGKTSCIQVSTHALTGSELKLAIERRLGIPSDVQRISAGKIDVRDDSLICADVSGNFPSCTLLFRLNGGKGGFGSLLRGAGNKGKKTSNFDACRDMSGRRLRHVNAEKQLLEWKEDAEERELEKAGEEYLKKLAKEKKENDTVSVELTRLRENSALAMESVVSAVEIGLLESKKQKNLQKRTAEENSQPRKKSKLLSMLEVVEDTDDEDEDSEEESEVIGAPSGSSSGPSDGTGCTSASEYPEEPDTVSATLLSSGLQFPIDGTAMVAEGSTEPCLPARMMSEVDKIENLGSEST